MLFSCMRAELMKLKRSFIWVVFLILPLISTVMGCANYLQNVEILDSHVVQSLDSDHPVLFQFFFGPLIAVYCAYLWRVENFNHNRNALMTAPVPIPILYLSQFLAIACVTLLTQLWVGVLYFISGRAGGYGGFSSYTDLLLAAERLFRGTGHSRPAAVALLLHQKLCPSHSNRLTGQYIRPSFFLQGSGTLLSLFPHAPGHEFQPGRRYPLRLLLPFLLSCTIFLLLFVLLEIGYLKKSDVKA